MALPPFSNLPLGTCNCPDARDRRGQCFYQSVAIDACEVERACRVLLSLGSLASGCTRLRPAEVRSRRPQPQAVLVVEAAGKGEVLVGLAVPSEDCGSRSEPEAHVAIPEGAA